jgi:acyl-CoA synthetase (AMP-forming)/AMP-acid ligase II
MTLAPSPSAQLAAMAAAQGDRPLFILPQAVADLWGTGRTEWSYADTQAQVLALRAAYAAAGYGPGHRVALLLENRPAHFLHWLALNGLGVSVVPVNPDATADEVVYLLTHSGAVLAVALAHRLAQVQGHGVAAMADGDAPPKAPKSPGPMPDPGDGECALIYTSGTTGRPKGCILSDRYFMGWGGWYAAQPAPVALRQGQERLMTPLPAFHVNAMGNSFLGMLATGGAQVIVDRFHPRTWWDMARETRATCFHYLGVMPAILLAIPPSPQDRDHALRFGMGGGAHPDHHAAFESRFGVPLLEGWAMTETGGACLLCAVEEPRHTGTRCLGRPTRPGPAMEVRLVDDSGAEVPQGQPGELWVRAAGPDPMRGLFSGYLNDPAATAAITAGGWLHTGDIMVQGRDGSLHFMDRKKNVIRRSGENIAALEVEGVLNAHSDVQQAAVVAADDPLRGEEVLAVVVPRPGADEPALARALLDHAAHRLAYYKVPGFIVFRDALPVTSTQKLRKADLGGLADNPMAGPRAHDLRNAKQALRPKGGARGISS